MKDIRTNGKNPNIEIYDDVYDVRLISDDFRKNVLNILEEAKPKRVFRFLTGKQGMIASEKAFYEKVYNNQQTVNELVKKLEETTEEGIWEFNGVGWEYLGTYGSR
jgi:hypothetical protein